MVRLNEIQNQGKDAPVPDELVALALKAKENAYVPYSRFHVGAAIYADNGIIYSGCNVENASYGATICAERTAAVKALSEGARRFKAVAIASDSPDFTMPCGICRQVLSEFCDENTPLYLSDKNGNYITYTLKEILPHAFLKEDLDKSAKNP